MAEAEVGASQPSEYIVTPVEPPRAVATFVTLVIVALGLLMVWVQSLNPFIGVPVTHPFCLVISGVFVLGGVGHVVWIWVTPDESWRKVPIGLLSPAVRELADAGKKREAIQKLRDETGAGLYEASRVVEGYLASQV